MRRILLFITFMMVVAGTLAQGVTTSSISGTVKDQSGGAVPGANIVAIHEPSGTTYGTVSIADGKFTIPGMRIGGPYTVKISFVGYKESVQSDIFLSLGTSSNLSAILIEESQTLSEVVVTSEKGNIFSSERTGASTNIGLSQLQQLPTLNRSINDFTRLTPQSSGSNFAGRNNLYNNISIDGSVFNNSFGLSSSVGGQANAQPISLDAIEEIQVNLAPYDVRQGGFTGAGINAVTKSGTNEFSGSVYSFFRNEKYISDKVGEADVTNDNFTLNQTGFRLGGPIIKNKLFFFVNGEIERRDDPGGNFIAARPADGLDPGVGNVSNVLASDLEQLKEFLIDNYNYDPGEFENYKLETYSDKIITRIDWNINKNHKFSIRYNYLKSYRDVPPSNSFSTGGRQNSVNSLPFSNSTYRINNNVNSIIAELNSRFGDNNSNTLIVGFTALRDFRESQGGIFPLVDIENGSNQTVTTVGYEPFTPNNILNTDIFQLSDSYSLYKGKHTLTFGTANEYFAFQNGFTPNFYGRFRFRSFADFYASANSTLDADPLNDVSNASQYELTYSAVDGVPVPLAEISAWQIGLYVQDEWQVNNNFKLTGGLRVDVPIFTSDLPENEVVEALTFANGEKIDVSQLPDANLLWSPRIGFNWDVNGDRSIQVRGGTGVFTGRIPFVWASNQASNNGLLFGTIFQNNPGDKPFSPDETAYIPANPTVPSTVLINSTTADFKFPQVWRTNIAVDQKLPLDIIGTLEVIFSKDVNAVFHRNANLEAPIGKVTGDGRDLYAGNDNGVRINDNITNAIVLDNTSEGYQLNITGKLEKTFNRGPFVSIAYNYGPSRDLTSSTSAIANTAFSNNQIVNNPNDPVLSYSNYQTLHRLIAAVSYRKEYAKHFGTTVSLFYEARSGTPYSYVYGGDMNGDRINGNDLIYIPRTQDEIVLVTAGATDTRTTDEIWNQLDAFIEQDPYLSEHRGEYAARNGAVTPWSFQADFRLLQDFYMDVKGKRNTLQLSFDIFNVGNLLNSNWGTIETFNTNQFLSFQGYESGSYAEGSRPTFSFPLFSNEPLNKTFRDDLGLGSRWQMQVGVRYIFN